MAVSTEKAEELLEIAKDRRQDHAVRLEAGLEAVELLRPIAAQDMYAVELMLRNGAVDSLLPKRVRTEMGSLLVTSKEQSGVINLLGIVSERSMPFPVKERAGEVLINRCVENGWTDVLQSLVGTEAAPPRIKEKADAARGLVSDHHYRYGPVDSNDAKMIISELKRIGRRQGRASARRTETRKPKIRPLTSR